MNWLLLCRMLGMLALLVGGSMVFSLPWAFPQLGMTPDFERGGFFGLLGAMAVALTVGGVLYRVGRRQDRMPILRKEALAVVGLGWMLAGTLGALPFYFSGTERLPDIRMTAVECLFESISGFTTTGASVIGELEDPATLPRSVLFWRCFTHWLGGMGIVVLFVAILGQLGAGGKALMRNEVPGPTSEAVRPRVRDTAMSLWAIYVGISAVLCVLLKLEGLTLYDALCHTFATMATGGFSTFNDSVGHFSSDAFDGPMLPAWLFGGGGYSLVEATITLFMFIAGVNFTLYYFVLKKAPELPRQPWLWLRPILRDAEFRCYCGILAGVAVLLTASLVKNNTYGFMEASRHSVFTALTITTTTGFGTEDFVQWPEFCKGLILALMFVGGCAGSTGGGVKVVRIVLFAKAIWMQLERSFRPNLVRPLRFGGRPVNEQVRSDIIVYVATITLIFLVAWLAVITIQPNDPWAVGETDATAEKLLDSASGVISSLNNIGPGLGILGPKSNYAALTDRCKLLLTGLMLLGRLEIYAVLVLFFPTFWRRG